jgi:microcystin-dependent protein
MPEPFLGQLALVPYNFAPVGWALCNGQLLPINQNQALFALLGTNFGGDGKSTFALPDLRGRVPISSGQGTGLEMYALGQKGGTEWLATSQKQPQTSGKALAAHAGNAIADASVYTADAEVGMAAASVMGTGSCQAQDNRQPYLTLNWIIALQGVFPQHP